jgi:hypothetical protein
MARTAIPVASPSTSQTVTEYASVANGHTIPASAAGNAIYLYVRSFDIATGTVTITADGTQDSGVTALETYTIEPGYSVMIGPLPSRIFGSAPLVDVTSSFFDVVGLNLSSVA